MPHFLDRGAEQVGKSLTAELRRLGQAVPAVFTELPIGFLEAGWRLHRAIVETLRTFAIADGIER